MPTAWAGAPNDKTDKGDAGRVGVAATVGRAHVVLWIAAVALLAIIGVSLASALSYALDGYGGFTAAAGGRGRRVHGGAS